MGIIVGMSTMIVVSGVAPALRSVLTRRSRGISLLLKTMVPVGSTDRCSVSSLVPVEGEVLMQPERVQAARRRTNGKGLKRFKENAFIVGLFLMLAGVKFPRVRQVAQYVKAEG